MGATLMLARAELRHRWKAVVAPCVVAPCVVGAATSPSSKHSASCTARVWATVAWQANTLAVLPARVPARTRLALVLRSE
jgi:hypothetical protein